MKEKVIFSWSGGKDSALALYELTNGGNYEVVTLLTTLSQDYDRTSMHGIRRILLEQQAQSLRFPLEKVFISKNASNEEYESKMQETLERYQAKGVCSVVFGDNESNFSLMENQHH
jgi:diphthamide synthase (EF-2-diphthine--ammonia ligase)